MLVHFCSDLHLDTAPSWMWPRIEADVLIIGGDSWTDGKKSKGVLQRLSTIDRVATYKKKLIILGNHEGYDEFAPTHVNKLRKKFSDIGFELLQQNEVIFEGVRFLGCTLWSEIPPPMYFDAMRGLNDYNWIYQEQDGLGLSPTTPITPNHTNEWHKSDRDWLEWKLACEPFAGKTVVVTHHHPTFKLNPNAVDPLSVCYCTNLEGMIHQYKPAYWLCGHIHTPGQITIGSTKVVCNPKGYGFYDQSNKFDKKLLLEV